MFGLTRRRDSFLIFNRSQIQIFSLRGDDIKKKTVAFDGEKPVTDLSDTEKKVDEAVVLIPAGKLIIRIYDLPEGAQKKVDNIVNYKFVSDLPFEKDEMYFTYYVDREFSGIKIILFAVRKDYLDQVYRVCNSRRIKLNGIFPLPVFNYYYYRQRVQKENLYNTIFIDYYGSGSQIFYWFGEDKVYIRGGKAGTSQEIRNEVDKISDYLDEYLATGIDHIYLNGREGGLEELEDYSKERYKDFLPNISDNLRKFKQVDFLKQLPGYSGRKRRRNYIVISILVVLILVVNGINLGYNWFNNRNRVEELEQLLNEVEPRVSELYEVRDEYNTNHDLLESYSQERGFESRAYLPWLLELSRILPQEVEVEEINFQDGELAMLSGRAESASGVMSRLESSPYFTELSFTGSITVEEDGEKFEIAGDLSDVTQ
ncbi:MAG: PilN domain-containing protein [Halanaerobiaceae bacterium]